MVFLVQMVPEKQLQWNVSSDSLLLRVEVSKFSEKIDLRLKQRDVYDLCLKIPTSTNTLQGENFWDLMEYFLDWNEELLRLV